MFHNVGGAIMNDLSPRVVKERIGGKSTKILMLDLRLYFVGDLMDVRFDKQLQPRS